LVAWLLVSIFLIATLWLAYRVPVVAMWVGGIYFFFVFCFGWLLRQPSELLALSIFLIWGVFGYWWFRLRPQKHFKNAMLSQVPDTTGVWLYDFLMTKKRATVNFNSNAIFETQLFGSQLSRGAILKRSVVTLSAILAIMVACKLEWVSPPPQLVYFMIGVVLPQTMVFGSGANVYIQLKKIWLLIAGDRLEILGLIEKRMYQQLAILGMANVVAVVVSIYFYNPFNYGVVFMLTMMALTFSLLAAAFYAGLLTYLKRQASIRWSGYVSLVFSLLLSLLFFAVGASRSEMNALLVAAAGLLLTYCLRLWLLRLWPRVNLLQGKV
jgi:hypothetical protein